jgi:SAM-dependent methyltransferase
MAQSSFRDPGGTVVVRDGRVLRELNSIGLACLDATLQSPAICAEIERGRFVRTEVLSRDDSSALLEHERIPFASYPYEWPPEMLHAAGALTLNLAIALAAEGLGLKDATPFNILFRGPTPVFVDLLSVEQRDPLDPLWLARAQFIRTFLLPLAAERDFGIPLTQSLFQREGIEPESFYPLLSGAARFSPKYLSLVSTPVWLGRKKSADASIYRSHKVDDPEKAAYILRSGLASLRKSLDRFAPQSRASRWSEYMSSDCSYSPEQFAQKEQFVREALAEFPPRRVLDVGANTGHFSDMAARAGASVVAIDGDAAVVGDIWRTASAEKLDILPLIVNLAQPTPPTGWRNRECPSFLERATGAFDMVMMLAVIHHMLATERVPLPEIIDLAADLTTDLAIIEFVDFEDPMFRRLSRGRDELYSHFHADLFEKSVIARFDIVRQRTLAGSHRTLYLLRGRQ